MNFPNLNYELLTLIFFTVAALLLLLTVILSIVWDLGRLISDVSGRTAKREISKLENRNRANSDGILDTNSDLYSELSSQNLQLPSPRPQEPIVAPERSFGEAVEAVTGGVQEEYEEPVRSSLEDDEGTNILEEVSLVPNIHLVQEESYDTNILGEESEGAEESYDTNMLEEESEDFVEVGPEESYDTNMLGEETEGTEESHDTNMLDSEKDPEESYDTNVLDEQSPAELSAKPQVVSEISSY